jgi:hypothetical protein
VLSDIYGMSDGSSDGDSLADLRKEAFAQEKDLRSEFLKTTSDWRVVEDSWNKLQANINTGTGPGDMAVVFSFMKMQDPNSAVREGEYATAENAGSATQRVIGIYNRLLEGDRLTPQQRAEFLQTAANLRNKSYEGYNAQLNRTSELAKSYQLNPERVARRYGREGRVEVPDVAASSQRTARPNPDAVWDEKLQVWTMEVPDG